MQASWSFWYDALPPVVLCGIVVAILHVSHRQAIGSPWVYPWVYLDIPMDIHEKICGYGCGYEWEISYPRQAWTVHDHAALEYKLHNNNSFLPGCGRPGLKYGISRKLLAALSRHRAYTFIGGFYTALSSKIKAAVVSDYRPYRRRKNVLTFVTYLQKCGFNILIFSPRTPSITDDDQQFQSIAAYHM